jgi:DNA polymerase-3 subunit alpha
MHISLHNHFDNDQFDGFQTIGEGVSRAKELGMTALAITSHGTMSYTIPFYKECKKQDIKPIIGLEAYFTPDTTIKERSQIFHLVLLAKNNKGYHNLKILDSIAYENFYYKPRIDIDLLKQYNEGIICLSACMGSIVNTDNGEYWVKEFESIFGENFYLEIQSNTMPEQKVYNHKILSFSRQFNIPFAVTTDSHYARKEDAKYHKYWITCNGGKDEYYPVNDFYIQSEEEVKKCLAEYHGLNEKEISSAIQINQIIADQCNVTIEIEGQHLPQYPVDNQEELIKEVCRSNWRSKVPKGHYQEYADRFKYEMEILKKANYLNYLLITWDILNWCREKDILTGIGRGSVGGSLVCYLLDIHKIDPIKHNLLFERFVNPYRVTMADIDNDCESARRTEIVNYISDKYGFVNKIRTFGRLGNSDKGTIGKGAAQRAGQALRLDPSEIDNISSQITESLDDILTTSTNLSKENIEELHYLSKKFFGRYEKAGCHASAILITPNDARNYVPIEGQNVLDESTGKKEWTFLASYDYHDLEEMGLLKLDLLGLMTLDVIKATLEMIPDKIDIENLPLDDTGVYNLYANGNTTGLFQVEGQGMKQFAKKMKVDRFEDIVALVALFRPGPLDSGMAQQYIDGKNGAKIEYLHPSLEPILKDTFGVIVYQEQVMKISQVMAGYNMGEADALRKIIGRKELDKIEAAVNEFIERSIANGYSKEVAEEIGRQIKACGRYIFNRSHAVEYAYTSYITAYLRYHYPKEYFCALLNSKIEDKQEKTIAIINECKRSSIKILPPDIRYSKSKWSIEGNSLRMGLSYIKFVGDIEVSGDNLEEIINSKLNKRVIESLVKAGALDHLGNRIDMLIQVYKIPENRSDFMSKVNKNNEKINELKEQLSKTKDTTKKYQQIIQQVENRNKDNKRLNKKLAELNMLEKELDKFDEISGEISVLGMSFKPLPRVIKGTVTKIFTIKDRRKEEMCFIDIDSKYGELSITVFANYWNKFKSIIHKNKTYKIEVDNKILKDIREVK